MKINIKVLGTGCSKCKSLEKLTNEVVQENRFEADVHSVKDIDVIISYGVMMTPAFVINDKVIFSGRVPSKNEIKSYIENEIHD
jgi:small redox-active disulfide protein 2